MIQKKYTNATQYFEDALDKLKNEPERGRYQDHLAMAYFFNGDLEKSKDLVSQGISNIEKHQNILDPYTYDVWLSGAYMAQALILSESNKNLAKNAFSKAEQIIGSNPKLVIRKKQLKELGQKLGY